MSRLHKSAWALLLALTCGAGAMLEGCAPSSEHSEQGEAAKAVGSVGLNLEVAPGVTLASVTYTITGNGFTKTGTIDVSGAPIIQATIGGIPAGQGFTFTLSATASDGTTASGSASFDVTAGAITGVTIHLQWPGVRRNGSVTVNGILNVCPVLDELTVAPLTAIAGVGSIQLSGAASDADGVPAPLSYAWTTTGGTLSGASTSSAILTSATAGSATVTLTISDGDCTDSASVTVTFIAGESEEEPTFDAGSPGEEPTADAGSSGGEDSGTKVDSGAQVPNTLTLVATSTTPNTASQPTAVVTVPAGVQPDDLAVVFLVDSGTVNLTDSPAGFTTSNLAASNHLVSYGLVGSASSLSWTFSGSPNTGATAYFFRGRDLSVQVIASSSTSGTSYGLPTSNQGPAAFDLGYAFFSVQLAVSSTPTIASGPGGAWQGPTTDGKQLYTWSQPYDSNAQPDFVFPAATGTLSASSTKRQAQVLVYGSSTSGGGAPGGEPVIDAGANTPDAGPGSSDAGTASPDGGDGTAQTQPNILLIISDDFGAEASSLYPHLNGASGAVSTPNLEALAANGLVFENAWANPVCSPTRGTIVSGLYGHRTGVTYVGNVLPTSTSTLFDRLVESPADYAAALFGKYHLGTTTQHVRDLGISTFRGILSGGVSNYYNWTINDANAPNTTSTTYSTTVLTNFAVDYIRNHKATRPNDPWFLYQSYNAPHFPYQVPPRELHSVDLGSLQPGTTSNTIPNYKAMIQSLDTEIGRLLSEVDLDNTIVIFIGDNGTEAPVKDTGAGVRGSKSSVYEGGVRIPFIVAGAGVTRRGRENALVSTADLYATILSLSGLPLSQVNNSYSIKPLLTDASATSGRTHNFTEMCQGTSQRLYAVRDAQYKLVSVNGTYSLYDLINDPLETTNLYNNQAHAAARQSLLDEIAALKANATSGCFQ